MRKPGRVARGYHDYLCRQCVTGIMPGQVKTFDPRCEGCADKLARGLRTGKEPFPSFRINEKLANYGMRARQKAARAEAVARNPAYSPSCVRE
jgi:hypothetical protein